MGEAKSKTQKKSWFKGMQSEFKKIVWPDRQTLIKQTVAVVIASLFLGAIIKIMDTFITYGINFLVS